MPFKLLCLALVICTSSFAQQVPPRLRQAPSVRAAPAPQQTYNVSDNRINYIDLSLNLSKFESRNGINSSLYFSATHYFNEFLGAAGVFEVIRGGYASNALGAALSAKYLIYENLQGYGLGGFTYLLDPDGADSAVGPFFELGTRFLSRGAYVKIALRYISADSGSTNLNNTSMMIGAGIRY